MKRAKLSSLHNWVVKTPLLGRFVCGLIVIGWPLVVLVCLIWGVLASIGTELKNSWKHRGYVREGFKDLFAVAFLPWENDLK